ncbi:MAG: hypothetical protein MJ252_03945 [archaeon]|nr:hypothetical protein [archaeon]
MNFNSIQNIFRTLGKPSYDGFVKTLYKSEKKKKIKKKNDHKSKEKTPSKNKYQICFINHANINEYMMAKRKKDLKYFENNRNITLNRDRKYKYDWIIKSEIRNNISPNTINPGVIGNKHFRCSSVDDNYSKENKGNNISLSYIHNYDHFKEFM